MVVVFEFKSHLHHGHLCLFSDLSLPAALEITAMVCDDWPEVVRIVLLELLRERVPVPVGLEEEELELRPEIYRVCHSVFLDALDDPFQYAPGIELVRAVLRVDDVAEHNHLLPCPVVAGHLGMI